MSGGAKGLSATAKKEIRYSLRALRRRPGQTATAALALALGIGLTTIMFSIVNGALLKGLPFEDSHELLHLERSNLSEGIESMEVTLHDYLDWRERQTTFEDIAAFYEGTVNVSGTERAERFDGAFITASAFPLLGVEPVVGRTFTPEETSAGGEALLLLGHHVWRDRYGGDPSVVGRTVRVNAEPATVVGVMPEGFRFPLNADVWVPLRLDPAELERGEGTTLEVFGRLGDGVSPDQAAAEMSTIAGHLAERHPETNEGVGSVVKPYTDEYIGDELKTMLWTMLGAVFLVLLLACANVANLLLARATERARDVAVRSALGASRLRVMMQFFAESTLLSVGGALVGTAIAWTGIRLFNRAIAPTDPPFWIDIGLDPEVLAFVAGLTLLAAVVSAVLPAVQATGANMNEILKDESRGSSGFRLGRMSRALVVAEVVLSTGLLVGAGLMIKSVVNLGTVDYAFQTEQVLTARFGLFEAAYPDDTARIALFDELEPRLRGLAGVEAASLASSLPGVWSAGTRFALEGESYPADQDYPAANFVRVSPDYFETYRVRSTAGRVIEARDRAGSLPVAVVNESFVDRYFDGEDPLGRRFRMGDSDSDQPWLTVVGVVPDMHLDGAENEDPEGFYVPLAQSDQRFVSVAVRTRGDPAGLAPELAGAVSAVDPDLPLYWVQTLEEAMAEQTWFYRVFGILFVVFGAAALFLASVGLYGVTAASVSRRTHEMGIRMALGARARDILRLVLRQGMIRIAIGLAAGLVLAGVLARGLELVLFQVEPWDPWIFVVVPVALALTGLAASWVPAKRATRVDPMVALRHR